LDRPANPECRLENRVSLQLIRFGALGKGNIDPDKHVGTSRRPRLAHTAKEKTGRKRRRIVGDHIFGGAVMADNLHDKGIKLRTQLFGEAEARRRYEDQKKFDEGFADFLNEQLFGTVWTRPGLPIKTRSMITMAALMVLARGPELRTHMRGALNLGITPAEIKELIIHLAMYGGAPTAVEAIRAFREVTEPK
jgi:4-carboxymuconolactone decarboxylase